MNALDLPEVVQTVLFLLYSDLTALVAAVIGPTYDNLLVPELSRGALYPPIFVAHPTPSNYLATAAGFSGYLIAGVVDPLVALLALGIALLYLVRTTTSRWTATFDGLLPRLVLSVAAANFTVPIAAAILSLSGGLYPVVAGWDGGAWHHWVNLAGVGELQFSWDNGLFAFVLSLVEFSLVLGLVLLVGLRDALLAVLLVFLPLVTLLWPFRPLAALPRRAWLLFVELAFLPCVLVVPLELAVNAPSPVLLVGYLTAAAASPFLLSFGGTHLVALGFPSASTMTQSALQRGLAVAPTAALAVAAPALAGARGAGAVGQAVAGAAASAGRAGGALALPSAMNELLGHGALSVARHVGSRLGGGDGPPRFPPLRPGGGDGGP